jgi:hypothetical protein
MTKVLTSLPSPTITARKSGCRSMTTLGFSSLARLPPAPTQAVHRWAREHSIRLPNAGAPGTVDTVARARISADYSPVGHALVVLRCHLRPVFVGVRLANRKVPARERQRSLLLPQRLLHVTIRCGTRRSIGRARLRTSARRTALGGGVALRREDRGDGGRFRVPRPAPALPMQRSDDRAMTAAVIARLRCGLPPTP